MGTETNPFSSSYERFEEVVSFLDTKEAMTLSHGALEDRLEHDSRKVFCQLFQDHLDLRAHQEVRVEVMDADGEAGMEGSCQVISNISPLSPKQTK